MASVASVALLAVVAVSCWQRWTCWRGVMACISRCCGVELRLRDSWGAKNTSKLELTGTGTDSDSAAATTAVAATTIRATTHHHHHHSTTIFNACITTCTITSGCGITNII